MAESQTWYIVKQPQGHCDIVSSDRLTATPEATTLETWGPFDSAQEAIAKRVGLIRSGKCTPQ